MPEWPVEVVEYGELLGRERLPIAPGQSVKVARFYLGGEKPRLGGMSILCPRCGSMGGCPLEGESEDGGWSIVWVDGVLTMNPSIVCSCGGHYWLHNGVLRDA